MTRASDLAKIITDANLAGTLDVTGETTLATHLNMGDNDKIKLGASQDLEIYHDGNDSNIADVGTGTLLLKTDGAGIYLQKGSSETLAQFKTDAEVNLYHNNVKKFETTSGGITVTGDIANASGDMTIDCAGELSLDGGGGEIKLKDDGSVFGQIINSSTDLVVQVSTIDKDFIVKGKDDGSTITALTLDMSNSGKATFNSDINVNNKIQGASGESLTVESQSGGAVIINTNGANERVRITSAGSVAIGTSSADGTLTLEGSDNPLARFTHTQNANEKLLILKHAYATGSQAATMIEFRDSDGTIRGSIQTTGSATAYNTSSDYRLKENVAYNFDATTRLKQLKPARFNFIEDADNTVDGFLAHEVSSIVPEAITGTHNEVQVWEEGEELPEGVSVGDNKLDDKGNTIPVYQGIDQSKLVPLLVKTIQELEARITALEE